MITIIQFYHKISNLKYQISNLKYQISNIVLCKYLENGIRKNKKYNNMIYGILRKFVQEE